MLLDHPVNPKYVRLRGGWNQPSGHKGMDYGWISVPFFIAASQENRAAAPGKVVRVYNSNGYNLGWGNHVIIQHGGVQVYTTYSHFAPGTIRVKVGDTVGRGEYLGRMGATGKANGVHQHFELRIGGIGEQYRVNPAPYFTKHLPGTEPAPAPTATPKPSGTISATQRRTKVETNRRTTPSTKKAALKDSLKKGVVGNFTGFIRGEKVSGNNIWFKGISGNYFWSGGFDGGANTAGLKDLGTYTEPKPVKVAKKKYVRIPESYIYYKSANDAARAVNRKYWVLKGDYPWLRTDSRGPREIQHPSFGKVWVGSTKTRPAIITK